MDKAGQLSKPLGARVKQQLLLRPDSEEVPSSPPGAGLAQGEARGRKGRAVVRGAERVLNESPKVVEGERLWQPQSPCGSNLHGHLPVETDQFPLGAPAARPGEQGCNTTPRETARWLEGLRPSVSIQNHHAVHLNSVFTLSWLFCVGDVQ